MTVDNLITIHPAKSDPTANFEAVTASNSVNFTVLPKSIYVGTAGNVPLVRMDDTVVTVNLVAGYHPIRPKRINATGLTASGLMALY